MSLSDPFSIRSVAVRLLMTLTQALHFDWSARSLDVIPLIILLPYNGVSV